MPSAEEAYLSTIAPPADLDLKSCPRGSDHTIRVCMGSKNHNDLGRRYFWCSGNNGRCVLRSPKSATLNDAQREFLRSKLAEFKKKLKDDKLAVAALGVRAPTARRTTLRSSSPVEQSDMDAEEPLRQSLPLSTNDTTTVHMFFGPSTRMSHIGRVANNFYSFRDDIQFREYSNWPKTEWLMYDIVQKRWIDIPTNCYIDAGTGPMITHVKDMEADLSTFEDLEDVIEHAFNTYMVSIERPRAPPNLQCTVPPRESSQTLAGSSSPVASSSQPRKRKRGGY